MNNPHERLPFGRIITDFICYSKIDVYETSRYTKMVVDYRIFFSHNINYLLSELNSFSYF